MIDQPETRRSAILSILAYHHWTADGETGRWGLYAVRLVDACT
jgi:hypothetical protein